MSRQFRNLLSHNCQLKIRVWNKESIHLSIFFNKKPPCGICNSVVPIKGICNSRNGHVSRIANPDLSEARHYKCRTAMFRTAPRNLQFRGTDKGDL